MSRPFYHSGQDRLPPRLHHKLVPNTVRTPLNIRHSASDPLGTPYRLCYNLPKDCRAGSKVVHMTMRQRSTSPAGLILAGIFCGLALTGCLSPITLNRAVTAYDEAVTEAISRLLLINITHAHQH